MRKIFLLLLAVASYTSAQPDYAFFGRDYKRTALGDAVDKASLKILKESYELAEDKNVIASPVGVLTLLSLYATASDTPAREEITRALGVSDYKDLSNSYRDLSRKLASLDPSYFTLANKVYVAEQYTLDDSFKTTARSYKSEVERINFGDQTAAAKNINQWAEEKTKGHIKNPVKPNLIPANAAAALFNVVFFQGHWHVPFNASSTQDKDFHVDKTQTVKKPTMHLVSSLFYRDNKELGARMVELPYKEPGFRMIVVLPNEIDGLPGVLEKVAQTGLLEDVFALHPENLEIDLHLPKFEINSKHDLNKILPKVGVSKIFTDSASGIVKERSVFVSKAFQEAFVKVDEEGATAGAFTGLIFVPTSSLYQPPPPIDFNADHPFLYLILYNDVVLFAGTYTH